jgi:hypothetical protein
MFKFDMEGHGDGRMGMNSYMQMAVLLTRNYDDIELI